MFLSSANYTEMSCHGAASAGTKRNIFSASFFCIAHRFIEHRMEAASNKARDLSCTSCYCQMEVYTAPAAIMCELLFAASFQPVAASAVNC